MDFRLLQANEIQMAVCTAHEVYERCVRPYVHSEQEAEQFYQYVCMGHLWQELCTGRLVMWGAFDGVRMCAVSAMQMNGHITMLYVRPEYAGRKLGTNLLTYMCAYAEGILHKEKVTICVTPASCAPYFYKKGFEVMQEVPWTETYLPLARRTTWRPKGKEEVVYEKRNVRPKLIALLMAGVLVFSFVVTAGMTICHIAQI